MAFATGVTAEQAEQDYRRGLLTICEARSLGAAVELERPNQALDCRCEYGAKIGTHISTATGAKIKATRITLEQARDFAIVDEVLDAETRVLMGAIDMNLRKALDNDAGALMRAAYCLGRLNERFLTLAGDIGTYRCKDRAKRSDYRFNAELARELMTGLEALIRF